MRQGSSVARRASERFCGRPASSRPPAGSLDTDTLPRFARDTTIHVLQMNSIRLVHPKVPSATMPGHWINLDPIVASAARSSPKPPSSMSRKTGPRYPAEGRVSKTSFWKESPIDKTPHAEPRPTCFPGPWPSTTACGPLTPCK